MAVAPPGPATSEAPGMMRAEPMPARTGLGGEMADIDVEGLVKRYRDVAAVDGLSFTVQRGEVFGMLGPNGAGKTTTLEIIEGLRTPDAGSVHVLGTDVLAHPKTVKERIGVQLQATALPQFTKVREAVELFAALYRKARPVAEVIDEFNLGEKADAYTDKLSGGQMQRLSIALALVNDPDLVFLDEPTTGLDPQARLNIWTVIEGIRQRRKTVVLTTHYMEEAERLCDRVAVIDRGRIVALDTPPRLIAEHASGTTIEFALVPGLDPETLRRLPGVDRVVADGRVSVTTRSPEAVLHVLLDPQARLNIWGVIEGIKGRGKTVVLTTHYMEEAERLCDRVAVIERGRIVALDTPRRLISQYAPGTTVEFANVPGLDVETLRKMPGVERVVVDGRVSITTRTPETVLHTLLDPNASWAPAESADGGTGGEGEGAVRDLMVRHGTLEDVFLSLTGRSLRE